MMIKSHNNSNNNNNNNINNSNTSMNNGTNNVMINTNNSTDSSINNNSNNNSDNNSSNNSNIVISISYNMLIIYNHLYNIIIIPGLHLICYFVLCIFYFVLKTLQYYYID